MTEPVKHRRWPNALQPQLREPNHHLSMRPSMCLLTPANGRVGAELFGARSWLPLRGLWGSHVHDRCFQPRPSRRSTVTLGCGRSPSCRAGVIAAVSAIGSSWRHGSPLVAMSRSRVFFADRRALPPARNSRLACGAVSAWGLGGAGGSEPAPPALLVSRRARVGAACRGYLARPSARRCGRLRGGRCGCDRR